LAFLLGTGERNGGPRVDQLGPTGGGGRTHPKRVTAEQQGYY
jgi:hypothetical protein